MATEKKKIKLYRLSISAFVKASYIDIRIFAVSRELRHQGLR